MNQEKAVGPRKGLTARLYSERCQAVVRYPIGERLNRYNLWLYFVPFVIFVDNPALLG